VASSLMTADVVPIASKDIESYWRAIDTIARERKYLTLLEAFPLPQTREFLLGLMERGDPVFVALANGEVVGWCDIRRHLFPAHLHRGTLDMGVVPDYRGRGIGARLMDQALKQAFATGFVRVELSVRADNTRAIRLYEKVGFVREGVLRDAVFVDGEFHDAIAMALIDRGPSPK
jgi:ribosomal protein S18 acetylase RimI-like enzyme